MYYEPTDQELQEIEDNPVDTSNAEEVTDDLYEQPIRANIALGVVDNYD